MDNFKKAFRSKLSTCFRNKKILVTGGTGSIGSEIVKQLLQYEPKQIRVYSRDDSKQFYLQQELGGEDANIGLVRFLIGDVRDKDRLSRAFNNIDIVFHTAALKHVPFCEDNPFEAIKTNVNGTQNVLDLAIDHHVEKIIAISTDKAVNPNTFMGITKLMMERLVVAASNYSGHPDIKFGVVRFGNVINSRGSVIPHWINQIKSGKPVTVTDKKMERYFMRIQDAINLVFLAATIMLGSEIFVLKMPKYNIYELSQKIIKRYNNGKQAEIKIIGARSREKMDERLFTDEERELMVDGGPFNIIQPNIKSFLERKSNYELSKDAKFTVESDILSSLENL